MWKVCPHQGNYSNWTTGACIQQGSQGEFGILRKRVTIEHVSPNEEVLLLHDNASEATNILLDLRNCRMPCHLAEVAESFAIDCMDSSQGAQA